MSTILYCHKCGDDTDGDKAVRCWRCGAYLTAAHVMEKIRYDLRDICRRAMVAEVGYSNVEGELYSAWKDVEASQRSGEEP